THPESKTFSLRYMIGFAGGVAIWLGSLLLPSDVRWIAWLVAIAFEAFFFTRPRMIRELVNAGLDDHHLVERQGIFTIIVLGEAFVKVLDDAQGTLLGVEQIAFGIMGVAVLCSLWWLYFSDTAGKLYDVSSNLKATSYSYGHLVLPIALVTFGVAIKKLFAETINYPAAPLTEEYRLALTAAIALFLLAMALVDYGLDDKLTPHSQIKRVYLYLGSAVVIVILGLVVTGVTATQFTGIISVVVIALVAINIYQAISSSEHHVETA
ncbi:MAG: low temperature requirement protein A, partial [Chloroflexi bacterium]|nr:low temperature requirement protein A [Chloroflexota bacterium]